MEFGDFQVAEDQWQASVRESARHTRIVYDSFLREGFDREQALSLTSMWLDYALGYCHDDAS